MLMKEEKSGFHKAGVVGEGSALQSLVAYVSTLGKRVFKKFNYSGPERVWGRMLLDKAQEKE